MNCRFQTNLNILFLLLTEKIESGGAGEGGKDWQLDCSDAIEMVQNVEKGQDNQAWITDLQDGA